MMPAGRGVSSRSQHGHARSHAPVNGTTHHGLHENENYSEVEQIIRFSEDN